MKGRWTSKLQIGGALIASVALSLGAIANSGSEAGAATSAFVPFAPTLTAEALERRALSSFARDVQEAGGGNLSAVSPQTIAHARNAFAVDPLSSSTQRTLAFGILSEGRTEDAIAAMHVLARMTKRDAAANLWLAQEEGRRGNTDEMIILLDRALRTNRGARAAVMPLLVSNLTEEDTHILVGRVLREKPDWEGEFWAELSQNLEALDSVSRFIENTGLSINRMRPRDRLRMYGLMRREGYFAELFDIASSDSFTGRDGALGASFVNAQEGGPLGWEFVSRGTYVVAPSPDSDALTIDGLSGSFGPVGERLVRVPENGHLQLAAADPLPPGASLLLSLRCVAEPRTELARVVMGPGQKDADEEFLSDECRFGQLSLSFDLSSANRDRELRLVAAGLREPDTDGSPRRPDGVNATTD